MPDLAGLSRAAFARKFAERVGTLSTVAASIGYTTEFAFSAPFKRHTGTPPGRWRRAHLADRPTAAAPPSTPAHRRR